MISQATSYAVFALTGLNGPDGDYRLVREVAEEAKMPPDYLAKIFNMLRKRGILDARRGVKGGVRLAVKASEISLLTICQALDDELLESRCMLGLSECNDQAPCPSHQFWKNAKELIINELQSTCLPEVKESLIRKGIL